MKAFLEEEKLYVLVTFKELISIDEQTASIKNGKKWSKKELIGHLIDSASNNHQRFIRAQFTDELIFPGYNQDDWVLVQKYQSEGWNPLINLWKEFNLHLIHAIESVPEEKLKLVRKKHNLDKIAMNPIPANQPATLEYFIRDYFFHLRYHVEQIFAK